MLRDFVQEFVCRAITEDGPETGLGRGVVPDEQVQQADIQRRLGLVVVGADVSRRGVELGYGDFAEQETHGVAMLPVGGVGRKVARKFGECSRAIALLALHEK